MISYGGLVLHAQIPFRNPSFEDVARQDLAPTGWYTCGLGSTPDVMPGPWKVNLPPMDGLTYVALITRENGTRELVAQRLSSRLKAGNCYSFSIMCAHAQYFEGGFNMPIGLRIWGGQSRCGKDQLLGHTKYVAHSDWEKYTFQFTVKKDIDYILFEAYYAPGIIVPYKGNILLDDCSPILQCQRAQQIKKSPMKKLVEKYFKRA